MILRGAKNLEKKRRENTKKITKCIAENSRKKLQKKKTNTNMILTMQTIDKIERKKQFETKTEKKQKKK